MLATTLALLSLTQAQPSAQADYGLRWMPRPDEKLRYDAMIELTERGRKIVVASEVTYDVVSIQPGTGFRLRVANSGKFVRNGADEIATTTVTNYFSRHRPDGSILDLDDSSNTLATLRSAMMNRFVAPPKPVPLGGSWIHERKSGDPSGFPGAKVEFTLSQVAFDKGTVKVNYRETTGPEPRTGQGTWVINLATGVPESLQMDVRNVFGAANQATISLKLIPNVRVPGRID